MEKAGRRGSGGTTCRNGTVLPGRHSQTRWDDPEDSRAVQQLHAVQRKFVGRGEEEEGNAGSRQRGAGRRLLGYSAGVPASARQRRARARVPGGSGTPQGEGKGSWQ